MPKTNHARNFKDKKTYGKPRPINRGNSEVGPFGRISAQCGCDAERGKVGLAHHRRGAKRFVQSRIRKQHKDLARQEYHEYR